MPLDRRMCPLHSMIMIDEPLKSSTLTKGDMDREGHGTCLSSKIAAKFSGVAKEASLILAKTTLSLGSFLDVLGKVAQHINTRIDMGLGSRQYCSRLDICGPIKRSQRNEDERLHCNLSKRLSSCRRGLRGSRLPKEP